MAKDSTLVHAWDGINQGVWLGAKGSTPPATLVAPITTPWKDFGLVSDNGITEHRANQETKKYAMQGGAQVKTLRNQYEASFTFQSIERNPVVDSIVNPGSTYSTTGGLNTINDFFPSGQIIQGALLRFQTGTLNDLWWIPLCEISATGDITYTDTDIPLYEMTVNCYGDTNGRWRVRLNDDPAFAVTGS